MSMSGWAPELVATFEQERARSTAIALEVMCDVFHRMPFGQQIALSNGKTATIRPFVEPTTADDRTDERKGVPQFGFDVVFDDGSGHIEFMAYKTGWGAAINQDPTQ